MIIVTQKYSKYLVACLWICVRSEVVYYVHNMYINDICNVSDILKFILFADNISMFYSNSDISALVRLTYIELEKLCVWFAVNRLSLNISKTNCMFFGNCILKTHVSIHISKEEISMVELYIFKCFD